MKLTIDEYGSWISGELDKSLRPTRSKATKLVDEAARALSDAREFYNGLARKGEHDMASKKDAASYRAARVIGHAGQEAAASLKEITVPGEVSWESLKVLKDGMSSSSRTMRSLRDSASRELSGFYLLDQRSFGGVINGVSRSVERLSTFLDGEGAALQRSRTMSAIVESILSARHELDEKRAESELLAKERDDILASIKDLSSKLDRLSATTDLREVLEIEKDLRAESRSFRSETLAHLKRPLRKLGDLSARGEFAMGSDERDALSKFVSSPYKSLLARSTGEYVEKILANMKLAIDSGKMGFKPKKTGRVSTQLSELVGTSVLAEKQEKGRRLIGRRRELLQKKDVKDGYEYRKGLLLKIDETRRMEEQVQERIRSVMSMKDAVDKRFSDLIRQAESKTREYVGKQVELERA